MADDATITLGMPRRNPSLRAAISDVRHLLDSYRDDTEERLQKGVDGITLTFRFAPSVTVACQQYLLYFAEFLADVGVRAQTEIREQLDTVLFSVKPKDSQHALSAIREALDVYLALPSASLIHDASDDIAVLKLIANIDHLKSQLGLAKALLQTQAATINAQAQTIELQRRLLTPLHVRQTESDREELFDGTIILKRYEGKGFDVSIAKIFRHLKRLLGNDSPPNSR